MDKTDRNSPAGRGTSERTRTALIEAGLALFGEKGFDATSTREIAGRAGANIGSIAYHFGGKEALRDACAAHIVATVQNVAAPVLRGMPEPEDPAAARTQLRIALQRMGGFLLAGPEAGGIVPFILRELQQPTRALDIIYAGVFEPVHRRLCTVFATATGSEAESEATKIVVFTLIGQLIYFRIGREAVIRRLGWNQIGEVEAERITAIAVDNLMAVLDARQGSVS